MIKDNNYRSGIINSNHIMLIKNQFDINLNYLFQKKDKVLEI